MAKSVNAERRLPHARHWREDGPYKVGIGHDPEKRLIELQAATRVLCTSREMGREALGGPRRDGGAFDLEPHHATREWYSTRLDTCIEAVLTSARDIADQVEAKTEKRPFDL